MNHRDLEKLLEEILPPGDKADFRDASLQYGLAGLRRERRRRQVVRFSAVAVVLLGLCVSVFFHSQHSVKSERLVALVSTQPAASSSPVSHVEFISDEQLLAVFANKPVALVGKPGEQRLVFLGKSEDNSAQRY